MGYPLHMSFVCWDETVRRILSGQWILSKFPAEDLNHLKKLVNNQWEILLEIQSSENVLAALWGPAYASFVPTRREWSCGSSSDMYIFILYMETSQNGACRRFRFTSTNSKFLYLNLIKNWTAEVHIWNNLINYRQIRLTVTANQCISLVPCVHMFLKAFRQYTSSVSVLDVPAILTDSRWTFFFTISIKMLGMCLKTGHGRFLPHPS